MSLLDSEYIIKYFGTFSNKEKLFIVTELVKDGDLFDFIVRQEFLEEFDASLIVRQLLEAVEYMHRVGVVHRDLKPENIMLQSHPDGSLKRIKIIDFGFASQIEKGAKLTSGCGTSGYMGTLPLTELLKTGNDPKQLLSLFWEGLTIGKLTCSHVGLSCSSCMLSTRLNLKNQQVLKTQTTNHFLMRNQIPIQRRCF